VAGIGGDVTRAEILATATEYVTRDRNTQYGEPEDLFRVIANLWSDYLQTEVSAVDVALMMALLKIARASVNPENPDNWIDLAGYAACGGEIATND
jgi:hypothetical protein